MNKFELNDTLFVLDTETGGIDPQNASLMEIAGIVLKKGIIVHKYSAIVKSPDGKYICSDFARKMHGITDDYANKHGKYPVQIIADLHSIKEKFFGGNNMTVVAHNASFDIGFVKKMIKDNIHKLENDKKFEYDSMFARNSIDTASIALVLSLKGALPFERCSLDNILKYYDIEIEKKDRHSALADAEQTANAFMLMYNSLHAEKSTEQNKDAEYDATFTDTTRDCTREQ